MLHKIEAGLMGAIDHGRSFCRYAYAYDPDRREVSLHGRAFAQRDGPQGPGWWASCNGWNTNRTRQAINALARHLVGRAVLFLHGGVLMVDGTAIDRCTWFPIQSPDRLSG